MKSEQSPTVMKTSQAFYHKGLFRYSEKEWPVKPVAEGFTEYTADGKTFAYSYTIATEQYDKALSLAIKESVPFEDQDAIALLILKHLHGDSWTLYLKASKAEQFKEGLYTFPEVEGEIDQCEKPCSDKCMNLGHCGQSVFRIKPSLPSPDLNRCPDPSIDCALVNGGTKCVCDEKEKTGIWNNRSDESLKPMTLEESAVNVLIKALVEIEMEYRPENIRECLSEDTEEGRLLSACLKAMIEYSNGQNKSLIEEVERLQKLVQYRDNNLAFHKKQVEELTAENERLKSKAEQWDSLDKEIGKYYQDDSEGDLVDIGEKAASAFGYL